MKFEPDWPEITRTAEQTAWLFDGEKPSRISAKGLHLVGNDSSHHGSHTPELLVTKPFKPRPDISGFKLTLPLHWEMDPFHDVNWQMHLNSARCLDCFLNGHEKTGNIAFLNFPLSLVLDWHAYHLDGNNREHCFAVDDMAAGLRAVRFAYVADKALCGALPLEDEHKRKLAEVLLFHWHLLTRPGYFKFTNHTLCALHGLVALIRVSHLAPAENSRWEAELSKVMNALVDAQFGADGIHMENSPSYHFFTIRLFNGLMTSGWYNNLSGKFREKLALAVKHGSWLKFPDGRVLPIGDSDGKYLTEVRQALKPQGRLVDQAIDPFDNRIRPVRRLSVAVQTGVSVALRLFGGPWGSGWHDKFSGQLRRTPALAGGRAPPIGDSGDKHPAAGTHALQSRHTGGDVIESFNSPLYHITRRLSRVDKGNWSTLAITTGHAVRTHKHEDDLSYVWSESRHDLVVDPGKYAYTKDRMRYYMASARAHNVIEFKSGKMVAKVAPHAAPPDVMRHAWGIEIRATAQLTKPDVTWTRRYLFCPGLWLVVIDQFSSDKEVTFTHWTHLDSGTWLDVGDEIWASDEFGSRLSISSWCSTPTRTWVECGQMEPQIQGWISRAYKQVLPAPVLAIGGRARKATVVAGLCISEAGKLTVTGDRAQWQAHGLEIQFDLGC